MPRKCSPAPYEPPKKKKSGSISVNDGQLKKGEIITDNIGNKWKLGKTIGIGGFGEIYDVVAYNNSRKQADCKQEYVAKIEKHSNGPLFVEINCYLRLGKLEMIEQWKKDKSLNFLGLPHFIASGSHTLDSEKYRFLIMPKYHQDLEAIFHKKRIFNLKTVLVLASRIIDILEYIHSHGYVHSDIKASNIMLNLGKLVQRKSSRKKSPIKRFTVTRSLRSHLKKLKTTGHNLRPVKTNLCYYDDIEGLEEALDEEKPSQKPTFSESECDQVYLLDYGLASKYLLSNGEHREFNSDQRKAHAGTVLFCSRDAHKGIPTRRSDLESLGYNIIYWLSRTLPWMEDVNEPEVVERKKNQCFTDVKMFLQICFEDCPRFLVKMFGYLNKLQFQDTPDYNFFRQLFKKAIKDYGYTDNGKLDFENLEGWGQKQTTLKSKENKKTVCPRNSRLLLYSPLRQLSTNITFKRPKLRKKIKDQLAKDSMMNWSKILIMDPETILKQATQRKTVEGDKHFNISNIDLESLNPTAVMRRVFNKAIEKGEESPISYHGDDTSLIDAIDGYTAEMMRVHKKIIEQKQLELEIAVKQIMIKKRCARKKKRTECLMKASAGNNRTDTSSQHGLRKTKSVPLKRPYRLRG